MKKLFLLLLIFLAIPCLVMADEVVRTWKSQSGEVILEALWDAQNDTGGEKVALKTAEGKQHNIPLKDLSNADQKYVTDGRAKKNSHPTDEDFGLEEVSETPKKMEKLLGVEPGRKAGERMVRKVNGVEYAFRWCPAGTFMMGSPEGELGRYKNETQHSVTLSEGFWMLETEVTVGMYRAFETDSGYRSRGDTPYGWTGSEWEKGKKYSWENPGFSQGETHPVTCVNWNDAVAFSKWLGKQLGMKVQLPTEAQWEYACRAGTTEALNNGKDLTSKAGTCYNLNEVGWYRENLDSTTHIVGRKKPNRWGLYDMHGNVWEWCSDWYGEYPGGAQTDPTGADSGSYRVNRGGGWDSSARRCRSANRDGDSPGLRNFSLGFRVSLVPETDVAPSEEPSEMKIPDAVEDKAQVKEPVSGETGRKADIKPGSKAGQRMVRKVNGVEYAFRWCPAGKFMMGSPEGELGRHDDEKQHSVTLSQGFWMLETEVTQQMWKSVMENNPSNFKGENFPVECVSWDDCQTFCQKLRSQGLNVQLPTEAQWEYACRAETTEALNNGKDLTSKKGTCPNLGEVGWYDENSDATTHAVSQKKPNNWGLYDMHGNVCEWCSDWYGNYPNSGVTDPEGADSGSNRVSRGGGWADFARSCRGANRHVYSPEFQFNFLGFRVSMVPGK